jgi:hypothetical protein
VEALHLACLGFLRLLASWRHFLVGGEEQNIVAKGLQALKRWAQAWKPHYFIVDLSSIEENRTFRGLQAGEQEVGVSYCTCHSRQALHRILGSYGKELMLQAMYKCTASAASS